MGVGPTAATAPGPGVGVVRAWWRAHTPRPPLGKRLDALYTVAISVAILGALLYGTASSALGSVVTPTTLPDWGPAVMLVALVATAAWGTWQGPVVFAPADVGFLLGAPLSRRALASGRLVRGLALAAGGGALVGALVLIGLGGHGRSVTAATAAGLIVGTALCGVLGVAGAAHVQCSARWSRAAQVALWACGPVAAGMVVLAHSGAAGRAVVLWSGPWGWAVTPAAGVATPRALVALAALAALTAAAAVTAARAFGWCPTERHAVRAQAREGAVASMGAFDARTARLALREAGGPATVRRGLRLAPPRRATLAVPWRDAVAATRAPARTLAAVLLAAGGAALAVAEAQRPAAVAVAGLGTYLAGALLVEPLRLEIDRPDTHRLLLLPPLGTVLAGHAVVPMLVATVAATIGAAPAGALRAHDGAPVAAAAVVVVPAIVLCAALSARRGGRVPISVLSTASAGDPTGGGGILLAWLAAWPAGAAAIAAIAVSIVARAASPPSALPVVVGLAAVAGAALSSALRGTHEPDD